MVRNVFFRLTNCDEKLNLTKPSAGYVFGFFRATQLICENLPPMFVAPLIPIINQVNDQSPGKKDGCHPPFQRCPSFSYSVSMPANRYCFYHR
jgi:hypothetical protein